MTELPGPLVDAAWLEAHMDAGDLVVADVRWVAGGGAAAARALFEAGHIPGAAYLGIDDDLAAPAFDGPGRHPLPSPEAFAATMGRAGIGEGTAVVAYDDAHGSFAARLWWMLDALGERAALLDGGLTSWGGPLETGPPATVRERTVFSPRPWPADDLVGADEVARALAAAEATVLDARMPERYRGEVEPLDPVAGHIPGAVSAPWVANIEEGSGRFLDPRALRKRFVALGLDLDRPAIAHCGSGVTACHDLLALRLAGMDGRLYEGSWSDWVHDGTRPVATGEEPGEPG
ncbi:MAG: sulfurtransferase [Actinomycetota bacterium]